ncbi:MAG: ParB/RepB/Spo0J family partition protein [Isosphaeraceae bacterium]
MTARTIIRKRLSELKHGPNIRSDLGSKEELIHHGHSVKKRQRTPLLILPDGTVVDGNRTLAAALLVGIEELDCTVIEEDISPAEYTRIQWLSNVHRQDISAYDKALAIRAIKQERPTLTNRQLAEEELDIDPALVTKYLSLFDCQPDVLQAAKDGLIGLTDWYAISKSPDQAKALAMALNGSTRDGLERESRRQRSSSTPAVRLPRIKIPLATDAATGTVTLSGDGLDLDAAETLLKEAMKAVKAAKDKNLDPKTAQAVWRDVAKAGGAA